MWFFIPYVTDRIPEIWRKPKHSEFFFDLPTLVFDEERLLWYVDICYFVHDVYKFYLRRKE